MNQENVSLQSMESDFVAKVFIRYLIPSLIGMLMMSVNVVIDGIFVGHRLGALALAGINIASPVFSVFFAMSLWIGIGGATLFSQSIGAKAYKHAQRIFTHSLVLIFVLTLIIAAIAYIFRVPLAYGLGANSDTLPYVLDYMTVLITYGFIITIQSSLSLFVRNDGNPNLAMISMIVSAVLNIILNYVFLFPLHMGAQGSALATVAATLVGAIVLFPHFLRKDNSLKFVNPRFSWKLSWETLTIGFPSFISEVGLSVFTIGYNLALVAWAGTAGVAAFSVLNYAHSVMLMLFLGMGSAIQPLISYYRGAKLRLHELQTIRLAVITAFVTGVAVFIAGLIGANAIVSVFGEFTAEVRSLAVMGIRIFFIAYMFMGINFVMMTYFQATEQVRVAIYITFSREIILMVIFLFTLPYIMGTNGIWLSIPISEFLVTAAIFIYIRYKNKRENALR
ncbi:MATE family efflux transporter [Paenibacillus pini]|uniref:Multidrug export protein MepA n=1 Tax=Paenibacillus pini JCM 16418 TaxID=1236976 RepID=W7YXT5_9BACL|nr:MATE family efflux transporter [Paenibacillus pini]GAF09481.1 multi antimicrobial extrusion protein [Paenibacillus pini JCM 16418]